MIHQYVLSVSRHAFLVTEENTQTGVLSPHPLLGVRVCETVPASLTLARNCRPHTSSGDALFGTSSTQAYQRRDGQRTTPTA